MQLSFRLVAIIMTTAFFILGCATAEEQAALKRQHLIEKENARTKFLANLAKKCKEYGFKIGTVEFSQCLQLAEQQATMSRSVNLQKKQLEQNEKSLFESLMELENKTRQQLNK